MRAIFIGMFIIALLAGVVSKVFISSSDQISFLGRFFNKIGITKIEKKDKGNINELLNQDKNQRSTYQQYLNDQKEYLIYSKDQIGGLSQMIKKMSEEDSKIDLLRLKDLMRQFEDKNALLIQNGDRLIEENQRQMKINQEMRKQMEANTIKTKHQQEQFLESFRNNLIAQKERITVQQQETEALNDKINQIKDIVKSRQSDTGFQSLSEKTDSIMNNIKQKKEQIQQISQDNAVKIEAIKQKIEDSKNRSPQAFNQANSLDKSHNLNDRVKDQMERLKEQRRLEL